MTRPYRDGLALTFAFFFPVAMALIYFVVLDAPAGKTNPLVAMAFTVGKTVQFIFPIAYVWWFERESLRVSLPTSRGLGLAVGFALIVAAAMVTLYFGFVQHLPGVSENTPRMIYHRLQQLQQDSLVRYGLLTFFICVPHSLSEEYYWRWFVFGWMRRYIPSALAIVLSSVGFMLHHIVVLGVFFPGNFWTLALPLSVCVAVGGGVWAWIYQRSGSLYAAWLSHALIDFAIMALGYWMLRAYWE